MAQTLHPLAASRLRLSRAKFHMNELDDHFRSYCRSAQISYHRERAEMRWNLKVKGDPTHPVIVGETIQNIRTALDYLIYALVVHTRGRKPREMTQFPIMDSPGDLFRRRYQISELPGELRRRIRKLQPYQSKGQRSDALRLIRLLSNADKHRLLIVTEAQIGSSRMRRGFTPNRHSTGVVIPNYLSGSGYEKEIMSGDPNLAAVIYVDLLIGESKQSREAFSALRDCLWVATEIIDSFEPVFGV